MPQGAFEQDATAFVQLPPDEALHAAPLEAPGHGYVPPMILPLTPVADPQVPQEALSQPPHAPEHGGWPEAPGSGSSEAPAPSAASAVPYTDDPHATAQWAFTEADRSAAPAPAPASDVTGQWTIPVARGDLPEETGEYTAAMLQAQQWSSAPPTLPGGPPAPWAAEAPTTLPGGAPAPWATEPEPAQPEAPADGIDAAPRPAPDGNGYDSAAHAPAAPAAHPAQPHPVPADAQTEPQEEPAQVETGTAAAPETAEPVEPAPEPVASETPGPQLEPEPEAAPEAAPEEPSAGAVPAPRTADAAPDAAPPADSAAPAPDSDAPDVEPVEAPEAVPAPVFEEHPPTSYVLRVNGTDRPVTDAWIGESLLYVLRERLGLAGAKDGCSQGECGACNVQVDGRLVASCLVPAATAAGSEVRTVEGLATDGEPSDVQRALAVCGAVQCGFCIPGMAMTVHDLLEGNHNPTELETRQALCGNLCRCSGYRGVLDAVKQVVAEREASAAALAEDVEGTGLDAGAVPHAPNGPGPDPLIPHQAPPGAGSVQPHPHDGGMA
ncbi:2Fe-2S iron-sulfur cluster-binding protein [Streptomyces sp. NPDC047315]|uniref:2Fe-2S iron-sulfur cluster-binding protein n=1 Tax=Streptomyces sp. NPDC047315 TaxID=3155142 RepID=UPI0033EFA79B